MSDSRALTWEKECFKWHFTE